MFSKILVANRGEIARRVMRTAKRLGIKTVAVYSDADANALFVKDADESVRLGPPPPRESYLNMDLVIAAAKDKGAQAIHPGYGFLSENAAFATAVANAGLTFVGPSPHAMNALGDKIEAKANVTKVGVPVVPGFVGVLESEDHAVAEANKIGFPVMLKAAAGGAITAGDPMAQVIGWAAALTGCLLTSNLAPLNPVAFDGRRLARLVQHDLLVGWGAPASALERAEDHVAFLEQVGPLAPRPAREPEPDEL